MRRLIAIATLCAVLVGFGAASFAANNPADYGPARIKLTFHQEKLLVSAVQTGSDRVVMPLTHRQQAELERDWPGWNGSILTVFPMDMLDNDGTIYVVPSTY
jgi:hypothetical protein